MLFPYFAVSRNVLLSAAPLIWVHRGGLVPPLQPLYDGPSRFCAAAPAPSPSESGRGTRWFLSAASRLARPQMPRLAACVAAADRRARAQAVLPQSSASRSQTRWSLHLLLLRRRHMTVPEPFFTRRGGFCMPGTGGASTASTDKVPISSTDTAQEVGPLTSSPPSQGQSSGGALWRAGYIPTDRQTSWGVLHHPYTVPVYKLLFNCQ